MGVYLGESVYNDSQVTQEWVEDEIEKNGKGVFFAVFNETEFEDIKTEYDNGKVIFVKHALNTDVENVAPLVFIDNDTKTIIFTFIDSDKNLNTYTLVNTSWVYATNSLLPDVTLSDNEKFMTVEDGELKLDYLPVSKFGVESPLTIKKDTNTETVLGFNTSSMDASAVATVKNNGDVEFVKPEYKRIGVYNDFLELEENETDLIIKAKKQVVVFKIGNATFDEVKAAYENGFYILATSLSMSMNRTFYPLIQVVENSVRFYFGVYSIISSSMIGCSIDSNGWTTEGPI